MGEKVGIGIIGGGLMGKEVAVAISRWIALDEHPAAPELVAVCDTSEAAREWFRRVPSVQHFVSDYHDLLKLKEVDVVYVAVPHHLHEKIYIACLEAGKDLFAEKPFGIDLKAGHAIAKVEEETGRFVRCSSEFPYFPGALRVWEYVQSAKLGRLLEVRAGFLHSSDLDATKAANWKRQSKTCGEIGVMGDLGMHVLHIPLRLGWVPRTVYAHLQKGYPERPDGKGGTTPCDTWDNATLSCTVGDDVPMRLEMKRLAPGETNTWFIEVLGTEGGVKYSTKDTKTLWVFEPGKQQAWQRVDLGYQSVFKTVTGGIFEFGFPDSFLQMWAAFLAERSGKLGGKFGCVTVEEALTSHRVFAAALESANLGNVANL